MKEKIMIYIGLMIMILLMLAMLAELHQLNHKSDEPDRIQAGFLLAGVYEPTPEQEAQPFTLPDDIVVETKPANPVVEKLVVPQYITINFRMPKIRIDGKKLKPDEIESFMIYVKRPDGIKEYMEVIESEDGEVTAVYEHSDVVGQYCVRAKAEDKHGQYSEYSEVGCITLDNEDIKIPLEPDPIPAAPGPPTDLKLSVTVIIRTIFKGADQ